MALLEVPLWSDSEKFEVKPTDVRAWLDFAMMEEDRNAKKLKKHIEKLEVCIQTLSFGFLKLS